MHTDIPTRADIERLAAARDPLSISIYLPTNLRPKEADENRLRARALIDAALEDIDARADKRTARALTETLYGLLEDTVFWKDLGRSLAIFVTPTSIVEFRLANELAELVFVGDRFAITPLLRAATFPQAAFVLALSQNGARLVEVSADLPAETVSVPALPGDAESSIGLRSIGGRSPYGRLQGDEGRKVRLTQYARAVDHAIRPVLAGQSLPLVIAATEPLLSIYRNLSGYEAIADESIRGNPDELTDAELADAARAVLDGLYARELEDLAEQFSDRRSTGRASTDLSDLARAATYGALATLAIDMDATVGGAVTDDGRLVDGEGLDALQEIARKAITTGARVLAVRTADLPAGVVAAGILRYRA